MRTNCSMAIWIVVTSAWLFNSPKLVLEVGVALTLLVDRLFILGPYGFEDPLVAVTDVATYGTLSTSTMGLATHATLSMGDTRLSTFCHTGNKCGATAAFSRFLAFFFSRLSDFPWLKTLYGATISIVYYLVDWLEQDFILQLLDVLFGIRVAPFAPFRQVVLAKCVGIWWNIGRWC